MHACARRCGAKHVSKSKCAKHTFLGPLLEVEMSKKCARFLRDAHLEFKTCKGDHVRTTFGRSTAQLQQQLQLQLQLQLLQLQIPLATRHYHYNYNYHYNYHYTYTTLCTYTTRHCTTLCYTQLQLHSTRVRPTRVPLHYHSGRWRKFQK